MAEKRYYWLKLKTDFFRQKEIKKLRMIAGGDTYTVIYLKMLLYSIENGGFLYYEGVDDSFESELALAMDEDADNVRIVVSFLLRTGLMVATDSNTYRLEKVGTMIGSESASAERVRRLRDKQNTEKALHCNVTVTPVLRSCNGEIEIEKDIEKEKEKETKKKKSVTFVPPSVEEVREYCRSVGSRVDPEAFVAFYESKGWLVGNAKMKSWKAAIVTWEKRNHLERVKPTTTTTQKPNETTTTQNIDLWND